MHRIKVDIVYNTNDGAWDLIVSHRGEVIRVETDCMEPDDAIFIRDLEWIADAIEEAYKLGIKDGGK